MPHYPCWIARVCQAAAHGAAQFDLQAALPPLPPTPPAPELRLHALLEPRYPGYARQLVDALLERGPEALEAMLCEPSVLKASVDKVIEANLLYVLLEPTTPLADKVTGMALEAEPELVRCLLGNEAARNAKMEEALAVLREAGDELALQLLAAHALTISAAAATAASRGGGLPAGEAFACFDFGLTAAAAAAAAAA